MRENNSGRTSNQNRRPNPNQSRTAHNILPSRAILESYEDLAPGSVSKLMDLAKKEQEHRHNWQDRYLKFHSFSYKTGQIFGLIYNIALLALVYNLITMGHKSLAIILFAINAGLIVLSLIVTTVERKITTRKPPRRTPHNNRPPQKPRTPRSNTPSN